MNVEQRQGNITETDLQLQLNAQSYVWTVKWYLGPVICPFCGWQWLISRPSLSPASEQHMMLDPWSRNHRLTWHVGDSQVAAIAGILTLQCLRPVLAVLTVPGTAATAQGSCCSVSMAKAKLCFVCFIFLCSALFVPSENWRLENQDHQATITEVQSEIIKWKSLDIHGAYRIWQILTFVLFELQEIWIHLLDASTIKRILWVNFPK